MHRVIAFVGTILFGPLLTAAPHALSQTPDCSARLSGISNVNFGNYDPFDLNDAIESDTIAVDREAIDGECAYVVVFSSSGGISGRTLRSGSGELDFAILAARSATQPLADATSPVIGSTLPFVLRDGQTRKQEAVFYAIPGGQTAAADTYDGSVEARLFSLQAGRTPVLLDRSSLSLTARVENRAAVNLAMRPAGFEAGRTNAEIDFGELEEGERERVFVQVRSTVDYLISMNSIGEGRLVLDQGTGGDFVPYQLRFAGQTLDLSRAGFEQVLAGAGPTSGVGVAHELEITIGDVSRRSAGEYSDTLTIRVEPVR